MLVKFNALTGASTSDLTGQKAIDYLNGIDVWKPASGEARPQLTRRARPPIPILGNPALFIATCSVLPFKNRYASGTLAFEAGDIDIHAFEAGDPDIRRVCDALMRDFEETAFAGIPEEHRPHIVWNAHTDKGRLELNFVFARAIDNGDGKLRSFNPKPPGGYADPMWKSFQDLWNNRYAWADPNDPTRARKVKKPKSSYKGPKHDKEGAPIKDIRDVITDALYAKIEAGEIKTRDDVLTALQGMGYQINRKSKAFVSIKDGINKPIRLQGPIYSVGFTSPEWLKAQQAPNPEEDLDVVEARLQEDLDFSRRLHAKFLRQRLKISDPSTPLQENLLARERLQDPTAEGYCEAEAQSYHREPPRKDWAKGFKGKLWQDLYEAGDCQRRVKFPQKGVRTKTWTHLE